MPANGAIYIQKDTVDLKEVFGNVESDKGLFKKATYFDVNLDGDIVRFNVMDPAQVQTHIEGFLGYISSLDQDPQRIEDTSYAISHTKVVLGLKTDREFEENHAIWHSLFQIADRYDGFVFAHDSVLLPSGAVLVGPLLDENA